MNNKSEVRDLPLTDENHTKQNALQVQVGTPWDGTDVTFKYISNDACKNIAMLAITSGTIGLLYLIARWAMETANEPVLKEILFILKVCSFSIIAWAAGKSVLDSWKGNG